MKWYFASRTRHQKNLRLIADYLKKQGEEVISDWIFANLPMPFEEHAKEVGEFAAQVIKKAIESDVFILVSDPAGTDMFVELGACLAHHSVSGTPSIYIIGKHSKRSAMQLHPSIIHCDHIKDVLEREGIEVQGFNIPSFKE